MGRKSSTRTDADGPPPFVMIGFKATEEYRTWLAQVARKHRRKMAALIDQAVVEWSLREGHGMPPHRLP